MAACFPCQTRFSNQPNAAADAKKAQGNECFKKKDYAGAIKYYSEAIEIDPSNETFYSNRSASYAGINDWEHAAEDGQNCITAKKTFIKGCVEEEAQTTPSGEAPSLTCLLLPLSVFT